MTFIDVICAARPNFMKVAPLVRELRRRGSAYRLVHTGQHYDYEMSQAFFEDLELPAADVHLHTGSGTHGQQTAAVLERYEKVLLEGERPRATVVVGDVNSTLACALAAAKLNLPVCHVEAGLRCGDGTMPEEINRQVTDRLADLCLAPSADAVENLRAEGIGGARVVLAGNVMIDSLVRQLGTLDIDRELAALGLEGDYILLTLHRPANVDDDIRLGQWVQVFESLAARLPMVWPVHPRTRKKLEDWKVGTENVRLLAPQRYRSFIALMSRARLAITDSGGVQEETSYLGVPCFTLRPSTERPVTVTLGTNRIIGDDPAQLVAALASGFPSPRRCEIPLWDGQSAPRMIDALLASLS